MFDLILDKLEEIAEKPIIESVNEPANEPANEPTNEPVIVIVTNNMESMNNSEPEGILNKIIEKLSLK